MRFRLIACAALPLALLALAGAPARAGAPEMSVAMFLAKVDALKAKGMGALFSSDIGLLKQVGTAAGMNYNARLATERAAGHPSSCPPKGATMTSDQLLTHLRGYAPPLRERTPMSAAMADYFIKAWPCR